MSSPLDKFALKPCPKCRYKHTLPPLEAYNISKFGCMVCQNRGFIVVSRDNPNTEADIIESLANNLA